MKKLTHIDEKGRPKMVDVGSKPLTERMAVARGSVYMKKETFKLIKAGKLSKGDVLNVAKLAGIMAAKKTADIIPLCHPLNITSVDIDFKLVGDSTLRDEKKSRIDIESRVKITGQTGVEMEALTAVSAAALTIYDMCKAVDKEIIISDIMLMGKSGGKSGEFKRKGMA
ncbi:MAG: cyclic pyranopterin monophosphate synthase MoaC [Thermodesulfovibrionales bacterium]